MRELSRMEFYKNAILIRHEITDYIERNFGHKYKKKQVETVIKGINQEDYETIQSIIDKYDVNNNKIFVYTTPLWFINRERGYLLDVMKDMVHNIISANTIWVHGDLQYQKRKMYQDEAIACCFKLYTELQYISDEIPINLNQLDRIFELLEKEIDLLKGWRSVTKKPKDKK